MYTDSKPSEIPSLKDLTLLAIVVSCILFAYPDHIHILEAKMPAIIIIIEIKNNFT